MFTYISKSTKNEIKKYLLKKSAKKKERSYKITYILDTYWIIYVEEKEVCVINFAKKGQKREKRVKNQQYSLPISFIILHKILQQQRQPPTETKRITQRMNDTL